MFAKDENTLIFRYDAEQLWVQPWGPHALRIRATKTASMPAEDWALTETLPPTSTADTKIEITAEQATLTHGSIKACISRLGKLSVYKDGGKTVILEEYCRNRRDVLDPNCSALEIEAREFKPIIGADNYHLTMRFQSLGSNDVTDDQEYSEERIYGLGQYQQPILNVKGQDVELAQRNSQASVPFYVSSKGYGFLWNNPAVGRAVFGKNITTFEAYSTRVLDYWIVAGDTPADIVHRYADVTGKVPMMPEYGLGFWQCKLRYQSQEELLGIAREYKKREIPLDVIVVDFFHWEKQGNWSFDKTYWPDPDAMVAELKSMDIELMVSIWPTVEHGSVNYAEMLEKGYLIRTERGLRAAMDFQATTTHIDVTNPGARKFLWDTANKNYFSKGIKTFWLDEAEPEYSVYDLDAYRYHLGPNLAVGNIYPREYARAFYEGQTAAGQTNVVNLLRCAWAGSQRYGALVWSGDIASSWGSFRNQLAAGLSMGMCGIPWWTTDIGGFHGGDPRDEGFRELFVRWFQWGAFCPVMRLHGDREPRQPQQGTTGGATCCSGAPNEVWSYGEEVYKICVRYIKVREQLREYTRGLMREAHEKGSPVIRPLFYEFPADSTSWRVETQYMFGSKYLVCPVLKPGLGAMQVYLPPLEGGAQWTAFGGKESFDGGQLINVGCTIEEMPVFERKV
ncbi:glycoside hydrolase family 31 protein [Microdochium trichocladiopsis]|uniref:Glycoside hydrolase family 31 protein n=1 Tax=Microdochium trichocladiopsis TaxID=1682393 RepID=A0A9P8XZR0_9PEZI|nr:glycoside hydrolase family 31 protein [Microdochium trichocladiopsis]KAH7025035.1 glycoside hydrolase family 31 protein [Microdochium trichocladiopsis]